ncbi:MAG: HNH endonuclease [Gammaproteobacteria bacterium]|nr:HNH endonuclease [Gammaproteobacteria bacterium]
MRKPDVCVTCGRFTDLTFHHLIPRKMHRRKRFQKLYNTEQLNQGIAICRQCHRGIHKQYDEMTLAMEKNSLQKLLDDAPLRRHFDWVAKQKIKQPNGGKETK